MEQQADPMQLSDQTAVQYVLGPKITSVGNNPPTHAPGDGFRHFSPEAHCEPWTTRVRELVLTFDATHCTHIISRDPIQSPRESLTQDRHLVFSFPFLFFGCQQSPEICFRLPATLLAWAGAKEGGLGTKHERTPIYTHIEQPHLHACGHISFSRPGQCLPSRNTFLPLNNSQAACIYSRPGQSHSQNKFLCLPPKRQVKPSPPSEIDRSRKSNQKLEIDVHVKLGLEAKERNLSSGLHRAFFQFGDENAKERGDSEA